MICPVCVANAALTAGSALSGGGFAAMAFKIFRGGPLLRFGQRKNKAERKNENGYGGEQGRVPQSRVA